MTKGGKSHLISLIIVPSKKCNIPPNIHAVNATDKPCVAARPAKTPTKAKLVPYIIGNLAPTGPNPTV